MSDHIAALPMYDWPERRAEVDAQWNALRDAMRAVGISAPDGLVRRNADLPSVPGGIRDADGAEIAPDPATLPPEELDLGAVWAHPGLVFGQTCWGPMERGLARHVEVVGQPDYSAFEGGQGKLYSSAVVMRAGTRGARPAPADGGVNLPVFLMRGRRLAFNGIDSMSGLLALQRDLLQLGEGIEMFSERLQTGSHRNSIEAVADGRADVAAIDCMSWALARRFLPAANAVVVVGWTAPRPGLPFIASRHLPAPVLHSIREIVRRNVCAAAARP